MGKETRRKEKAIAKPSKKERDAVRALLGDMTIKKLTDEHVYTARILVQGLWGSEENVRALVQLAGQIADKKKGG